MVPSSCLGRHLPACHSGSRGMVAGPSLRSSAWRQTLCCSAGRGLSYAASLALPRQAGCSASFQPAHRLMAWLESAIMLMREHLQQDTEWPSCAPTGFPAGAGKWPRAQPTQPSCWCSGASCSCFWAGRALWAPQPSGRATWAGSHVLVGFHCIPIHRGGGQQPPAESLFPCSTLPRPLLSPSGKADLVLTWEIYLFI